MSKRVLSVGQCVPDHYAISRFLTSNFDVTVDTSDLPLDTWQALERHRYDLVLVNRKLDADYSDGMEIIRRMQTDLNTVGVPVMLVSNFDEYQQQAVAAGALYGFGKAELHDPAVRDRVASALAED